MNILSTVPTYPSEDSQQRDYDSWDGTSMATPHAAAAAALLLARNTALTVPRVMSLLRRGAERTPLQRGRFSASYGYGRLNVERSLALLRGSSSRWGRRSS